MVVIPFSEDVVDGRERRSIVVVIAVAVALGFRPTADPVEWLATIGMILAFSLGLVCLAAALGLVARASRPRATPRCSSPFYPSRERLRADRLDASRPPAVRRVPTVHPITETVRRLSPVPGSAPRPSPHSRGVSALRPPPTYGPGVFTNITALAKGVGHDRSDVDRSTQCVEFGAACLSTSATTWPSRCTAPTHCDAVIRFG